MTVALRLDAVGASNPGLVRRVNEDRHSLRSDSGLWAVADGMGGHAHGDWAANAVVQALESTHLPADFDAATRGVADAIHSANRRIWAEAQRRGQQMGSTVVALLARDTRFSVAWVGDSRGYLLRGGTLIALTRDHSQVQEMVDRGLISPAEARHHPRGHVLARAIGVGGRLQVDVVADEVEPGDLFLLCSDGLTGVLDDEAIAAILIANEPQAALDMLIETTLDRGAPDNVTAILVSTRDATRLDLKPGP